MSSITNSLEDAMRKSTNFVGIEPDRFLGVFSLVLGFFIASDGTTRFGQFFETFGFPLELSTYVTAFILMTAGMAVLIGRPRSATGWWLGAAPLFAYNVLTAVAVLRLNQPISGAVVSITFVIALFAICDYYITSQRKTEALDHKDAEIAHLKAKLAAYETKVSSEQ